MMSSSMNDPFGARAPLNVGGRQYLIYRRLLSQIEPQTKIFLAISEATYTDFFTLKATQFIIETEQVSLFTVNLESEEIERWIKH